MNIRRAWGLLAAVLCAAGALSLASCATARGSTLGQVISTEARPNQPAPPSTSNPPSQPSQTTEPTTEPKKGLEVDTDPDNAEVWIDGSFRGLSPYLASDIPIGWHQVTVRKQGYYDTTTWVEFTTDYMLYQATLTRITGFLQLQVTPPDATTSVGGTRMQPGLLQLAVGSYAVVVRAFGYTDYRATVTIQEKAITALSVVLSPAPFAITTFALPKGAVNPDSPGLLGTLEAGFSVSGPGTGSLVVTDSAAKEIFSQELPRFTTWDQDVRWNLRDATGRALPDGTYTMAVVAKGDDGSESVRSEASFRVDRTLKVAARSVWSGGAGLLYAPVAETLPKGDFQAEVLGIACADPSLFRAPIAVGARIGLGNRLEVDGVAGLIPSSVATPLFAGVAARWNLHSPAGEYGTAAAFQAKVSVQLDPGPNGGTVLLTDTFANFTGISAELPLELVLGRVSLLLSPGVIGSLWYPYGTADASPLAWLYLRTGALVDLGDVTAGLSLSTRTEPLPGGVTVLASPIPYEAAAEIHWLVPGTQLLLSAVLAEEYQDANNFYFMGGGGLGFLY